MAAIMIVHHNYDCAPHIGTSGAGMNKMGNKSCGVHSQTRLSISLPDSVFKNSLVAGK